MIVGRKSPDACKREEPVGFAALLPPLLGDCETWGWDGGCGVFYVARKGRDAANSPVFVGATGRVWVIPSASHNGEEINYECDSFESAVRLLPSVVKRGVFAERKALDRRVDDGRSIWKSDWDGGRERRNPTRAEAWVAFVAGQLGNLSCWPEVREGERLGRICASADAFVAEYEKRFLEVSSDAVDEEKDGE